MVTVSKWLRERELELRGESTAMRAPAVTVRVFIPGSHRELDKNPGLHYLSPHPETLSSPPCGFPGGPRVDEAQIGMFL